MAKLDLTADLETIRTARPRYFRQWLDAAEPEDKKAVMDAVMDASIPANQLAVLLTRKHDIPITRETIEGYRAAQG